MAPPQPKKRKTANVPLAPENTGSGLPRNPSSIEQMRKKFDIGPPENSTSRVANKPARQTRDIYVPRIPGTPVRRPVLISQDQGARVHSMGSASRMFVTPARPLARTVHEQIVRPSPVSRRPVSSKSGTPMPRSQRQSTVIRAMSARNTPMGSASKVYGKVASSFPGVALDASDSDDSSDDNFKLSRPIIVSNGPRLPPQGNRAARKLKLETAKRPTRTESGLSQSRQISLIDSEDENSDEEVDDLYVDDDPANILHRAQRLRDGVVPNGSRSPSPADGGRTNTPEDLERDLNNALNALSIREVRLQARGRLPFLRRNVRKSMDALGPSKWRGHDPDAVRSTGVTKVTVVYITLDNEFPGGSFCGGWFCPVCAIEMRFDTRGALDTHLFRYHSQCDFEWENDDDNSLLLKLTVPEVPESDTESEDDAEDFSTSEEEDSPSDDQASLSLLSRSPPLEEKPFLRGSSVVKAQAAFSSSPIKVQPVSPQLSPLRPGEESEPATVLRPPRPIDPANPARYPTPPPLADLEGPAAVYPFLSEETYSARPGGPRLYDILNELTLEPFGLMSWYIIDREEDVFELDNVRDEDKVMLALWGRWIFLNRTKFIENYDKGIRAFIDEYWPYIHRAAGFAALRILLLVLVRHRFLTGSQFCDALKYYMDKVGTEQWK